MKYIDADKLEDKLIEIEERHPAFCESVYDNAYSNCLNEVRLIISSLLKEQISPLKGKFTFPKFLYARTLDNKTIDISYAPQNMEAVEYVRNDFIEQGQPEVDLEKEVAHFVSDDKILSRLVKYDDALLIARHFYELGLNARKEE